MKSLNTESYRRYQCSGRGLGRQEGCYMERHTGRTWVSMGHNERQGTEAKPCAEEHSKLVCLLLWHRVFLRKNNTTPKPARASELALANYVDVD